MTVHGQLLADSLRRLERVCGPALAYREAPLVVHLEDVSETDPAARAFLALLERRGAVLCWGHEQTEALPRTRRD